MASSLGNQMLYKFSSQQEVVRISRQDFFVYNLFALIQNFESSENVDTQETLSWKAVVKPLII